jgi:hypothetical protein
MISSRLVVRRYSRPDFSGVQRLERHTFLLGVLVRVEVLDTEKVPAWAAIQSGALGYTDWRSRFAEHIDAGA